MILDDNCYLNGKQAEFNPEDPYIIVVGALAIGKSQYSKVMSKYNKGVQYYSSQRFTSIDYRIRQGAIKIINIMEVSK